MLSRGVALYARVSTDQQARDNTIASQLAALHERIAAEDDCVLPEHIYIDEGYSGAGLVRPALERLRDAVAMGLVGRLYVHAPDRLARRYAHQVLLIEELRRAGTEVVFLNHPIGGTAEDDLLLQVQGVIAEYERAKILERGRRGRRHAARSGSLSAFTTAPYGYRYVSKASGGGKARFEIIEEEACIVRKMFEWVALERVSLREVCRRLVAAGYETRGGQSHWHASTVRGMLTNTAYIGRAVYGHSRYVQAPPRLRPIRGHPHGSPRPTGRIAVPREEWIEVPVPALVDEALFEAIAAQLAENGRRKRDRRGEAHWLLQGLTVCVRCGYAYYGKTSPRSKVDRSARKYRHYRCAGTDGDRFGGKAVCDNQSVNADRLEAAVWERVRAVLDAPEGVAAEHRRRMRVAQEPTAASEAVGRIERQIVALRRGTDRLIDAFTAGIIDRAEFEPRIAGLKARSAQLEAECRAVRDAEDAERQLVLVLARLEDFAVRVRDGLDRVDWHGRRDLIRTLVRRIEIDRNQVEMVFRVPAPGGDGPPPPPPAGDQPVQQDCTADAPANPGRFNDAYLGGERSGGKRGRGAAGKTPFVAAVETTPEGKPVRLKLRRVTSFCSHAISGFAKRSLDPNCEVVSDGLACFAAVTNAGCRHQVIKTGSGSVAARTPAFKWVNTALGNIKAAITGTYRSIHQKHVPRYLAEFEYRFNRRYDLAAMLPRLSWAAARTPPMPYRLLKLAELSA